MRTKFDTIRTLGMIAGGAAMLLAGAAFATNSPLKLSAGASPFIAKVERLNGTVEEISDELERRNFQAYALNASIDRWLRANSGGTKDIYLALPTERTSLGWTLVHKGTTLCMQAPDGGAGAAMEAVAFLVAAESAPSWTANPMEVCD